MLEVLYKYYFKLVSIRPFGTLDLKIRRFLGVLFSEASTRSDLTMIRHLAQNRQAAIDLLVQRPGITPEQLPCIDILVVANTSASDLQAVLNALGQQSYPSDKITLTVILNEEHVVAGKLTLPDYFLNSRYVEITNTNEPSAYTNALKNLKAPYFLLMAHPLVLGEHGLVTLMQGCISSHPATGFWEVNPTLINRTLYYDPVSLEIPCSTLECGVIKRDSFDAVGGFDEQFPISGQGLELGYRLRAHGYRLKNSGQPGLFEQPKNGSQSHKLVDQHTQQNVLTLMRMKYGNWFQKALAVLRLKRFGGKAVSEHIEDIKPSRLQGDEYEISMGSKFEPQGNTLGDSPKVSIIIRTFARRGYWLRESVCSVLNQTYPNIELIVVEDGSTEYRGFIDIVSTNLRQGQSLKYLTQEKKGKSHAGNLGLANAEGLHIGFLDDDDLLFPTHVELLLGLSIQDKNAVGACALAWEVQTFRESGQAYSEEHFEVSRFTRQPFSRAALEKRNIWSIQSILFDRKLYDQYGGFKTDRVFLEDWELWLRYTQGSYLAHLPQITSLYRTPADPYERLARVSNPARRAIEQ